MKTWRAGLTCSQDGINGNIKLTLDLLAHAVPEINKKKGRGRKPKHKVKNYITLLILKEFYTLSLRNAELIISKEVCNERVDHSVIHYWERTIPNELIECIVRRLGYLLDRLLGYNYTVIDGTRFSSWNSKLISFHLVIRVGITVYPVSIARDSYNVGKDIERVIVKGRGYCYCDRWYDVNPVYKVLIKNGYIPVIKPNRRGSKGYYLRKGRKIYAREWRRYRYRSVGESVFGSLTNWFGNRLNTRLGVVSYKRCMLRVVSYQLKIVMRVRSIKGVKIECLIIFVINF